MTLSPADPVSSPAYLLLGHSRLNQGEAATAVEPLQRAVFLDPLAGHAHFLLAVALSAAGRSAQAAPAYRAAANTLAGVPDFIFVQWIAPLVSEFPEMLSTLYWARRSDRAPGRARTE
jgi:cytochrome c-type biogenesis protein CcmH/NrfG